MAALEKVDNITFVKIPLSQSIVKKWVAYAVCPYS